MNISSLVIFLFILPLITSECDLGGTWSTWMMDWKQPGYDYCGSCWQSSWIRECLSEPECPCNGTATYQVTMSSRACSPPRNLCCPGTMAIDNICSNSTLFPPDTPPRNSNYCPPSGSGVWGSWSEWGTCSATCGLFGIKKRTRPCLSEAHGCPCCTSETGECQTMPCPEKSCTVGRNCSGEFNLVSSFDGKEQYCSPFEDKIANGNWTEWAPAPNAKCNDTCDQISVIQMIRYCLPSGSSCAGPHSRQQPCPPNLCPPINYSTYHKCPVDRTPRLSTSPVPGIAGSTGDASINETFVTCKVENGSAAIMTFVYQDDYGTPFYSMVGFYDKTTIRKFKCDSCTDKNWGAFDFFCFTVPYPKDTDTVVNTKNSVHDYMMSTYIPTYYSSNYLESQYPPV